MTEEQRLFLVQAKADFVVFTLLKENQKLPRCHALHYLQMATELLGKASSWKDGPVAKSHKALVRFLRGLVSNKQAQRQLGYLGQNQNWIQTIRKLTPLAESIQQLAPALANDGPNAEYPWPPDAPTKTPVEFDFPIWKELTDTVLGKELLKLLKNLFENAEEYM